MTTGESTHLLRDGTRLMISGTRCADPARQLVTGRMMPDQEVEDGDVKAALAAALRWVGTFRVAT
jgi:hypothetical protein